MRGARGREQGWGKREPCHGKVSRKELVIAPRRRTEAFLTFFYTSSWPCGVLPQLCSQGPRVIAPVPMSGSDAMDGNVRVVRVGRKHTAITAGPNWTGKAPHAFPPAATRPPSLWTLLAPFPHIGFSLPASSSRPSSLAPITFPPHTRLRIPAHWAGAPPGSERRGTRSPPLRAPFLLPRPIAKRRERLLLSFRFCRSAFHVERPKRDARIDPVAAAPLVAVRVEMRARREVELAAAAAAAVVRLQAVVAVGPAGPDRERAFH